MTEFVVNFFVWWYAIRVREFFKRIYGWALFILEYTNTLPMAQNLFVPLFQDNTGIGRVIGFAIRITWVWFGGMASAVFILPLGIVLLVYALLPIIFIIEILLGVINLFIPS